MKLSTIKDECIEYFKGIDDELGINIITDSNVAEPNKQFKSPSNGRWFELSFMPSQPAPVGIGENTQERVVVVMQIDICTPLNVGTDEADDKVALITNYFKRGTVIGDAEVESVYLANEMADANCYRAIVRVNLTADIDR